MLELHQERNHIRTISLFSGARVVFALDKGNRNKNGD